VRRIAWQIYVKIKEKGRGLARRELRDIYFWLDAKLHNFVGEMNYEAAKWHILRILDNELSEDLTYHGKHHTLDVLAVTQELCQMEKVGARETVLLLTAALLHDIGFTIGNKDHEQKSCIVARRLLPRYGYAADDIEQVCGMIMATKIPQSPKNYLEEILCDADLDYLGRDDFHPIAATLYQELRNYHVLKSEDAWNRIQVAFIGQHHYFTASNQGRREAAKQRWLNELREKLPD
jgi:uncharacterized protein